MFSFACVCPGEATYANYPSLMKTSRNITKLDALHGLIDRMVKVCVTLKQDTGTVSHDVHVSFSYIGHATGRVSTS